MDKLFEKFYYKADFVSLGFQRYLMHSLPWNNRMVGIKGARGTGKTTMILQYAKQHLPAGNQTLYVSLDDFYFTENKLQHLASDFVKQGGKYLLLDEVHRYPDWSLALKNIYDDYPTLQVIFTGSSILKLSQAPADLSRRALMFELAGLSFREYLNLQTGLSFTALELAQILSDHNSLARDIVKQVRPFQYFNDYLHYGYYPYFMEDKATYSQKLTETINLALNYDLPVWHEISYTSIEKLRQLIYIISQSVPFQPNVSKLSQRIDVTRNTLVTFFRYLDDLRIIRRIFPPASGIGVLQKPDKILMHHPNLQFALAAAEANLGSIRESFFVNQVSHTHTVAYAKTGDFLVDGNYTFEVGGKAKTGKQIHGVENAFIVSDDLEIGSSNKIPLWLFGFLY